MDAKEMFKRVKRGRVAGMVRRYHTMTMAHPEDVAQHSFNVMNLLMIMTDGQASRNLMIYALMHDQGEWMTGDTPSTVKRSMGAELKAKLDAMEEAAVNMIHASGLPEITPWEYRIFKMADNLDGLIKVGAELNQRRNKPFMLMNTGRAYIRYLRQLTDGNDGPSAELVAYVIDNFERKFL